MVVIGLGYVGVPRPACAGVGCARLARDSELGSESIDRGFRPCDPAAEHEHYDLETLLGSAQNALDTRGVVTPGRFRHRL